MIREAWRKPLLAWWCAVLTPFRLVVGHDIFRHPLSMGLIGHTWPSTQTGGGLAVWEKGERALPDLHLNGRTFLWESQSGDNYSVCLRIIRGLLLQVPASHPFINQRSYWDIDESCQQSIYGAMSQNR